MSSDPNLQIRLERARSWISMAQKKDISDHARFIFYWIAFNAMCGLPPPDLDHLDRERQSQMAEIGPFLLRIKEMRRLDNLNGTCILDKAVKNSRQVAKALITDPFLSKKYWKGTESPGSVSNLCKTNWERAQNELDKRSDPSKLLDFSFLRLTVLRNQIIHGSASADSHSRGYESLKSGMCFVQVMVPALLQLIEKYGERTGKWPKAPYPRIGHPEHPHRNQE